MSYSFNKYTISVVALFLIVSAIFLVSCAKDSVAIPDIQSETRDAREAQLKNVYANEIVPLNASFVFETNALHLLIEHFSRDVSLAKLSKIKIKWLEVFKIWKRLELYNLGAVEDRFIHFEINRWPTDVAILNSYIEGIETINEDFIASKGSSSKGVSALEYLLFSSQTNQQILESFTTMPDHQRRLEYLVALSKNIQIKAVEISAIWANDKGVFLAALEHGISGGQNQLANVMITLIEEIIISKLGKPIGEVTGGFIDVEALEAYRSNASLISIQEHLTALKRCYTGAFTQEPVQWGFDAYLALLSRENLDRKIVVAFEDCQHKINAIVAPLHQELSNNIERVIDLQDAFRGLLLLIKIDMATAIGATITINDNDGD
jgi:predicted lipoprotein